MHLVCEQNSEVPIRWFSFHNIAVIKTTPRTVTRPVCVYLSTSFISADMSLACYS